MSKKSRDLEFPQLMLQFCVLHWEEGVKRNNCTGRIKRNFISLILFDVKINNHTDAGLHVVIELVGIHIYTITLVCVFMYARLLSPVL